MRSLLFLFLLLSSLYGKTQWYIAPVAGYQLDVHNDKEPFHQFTGAVQAGYRIAPANELLLQVQQTIPGTLHFTDSSFTLNAGLPLYAPAQKALRAISTSIAIGTRVILTNVKKPNAFALQFMAGLKMDRIRVNYYYNKAQYVILNPDKDRKRIGPFLSLGACYIHTFVKNKLLVQLDFATPPYGKKIAYPSSFNFIAPLQLSIGYTISLSK